jgi:hypothetical protein
MFDTKSLIRTIYLYLFSLVGLFILIFGSIGLIRLGLTTWVFPEANNYEYEMRPIMFPGEKISSESDLIEGLQNCEETCDLNADEKESLSELLAEYKENKENYPKQQMSANRQRELSQNLASILVGLPLYLYHWMSIKKDIKKKKTT